MKKIITVLIATLCLTGFQMKAEAGSGSEVAGAVIGTVLCAGIITAAILDCDDYDRGYRHDRGHYYSGRDRGHRHNRDRYYSGRDRGHRHNRDRYYSGRRNSHRHSRCD